MRVQIHLEYFIFFVLFFSSICGERDFVCVRHGAFCVVYIETEAACFPLHDRPSRGIFIIRLISADSDWTSFQVMNSSVCNVAKLMIILNEENKSAEFTTMSQSIIVRLVS